MRTLKIFDLIGKRVLVTRDSARSIRRELALALDEGNGEVVLDFAGVDGLTPSFLDETLSVVEECIQNTGQHQLRLIITHPPTQLSSKFAAVGRGHGLVIEESEAEAWTISRSGEQTSN
jgi:hypothetical protein